ncbi:DUF1361 domain-containing protein [Desertivirga arenae]|uniref:DUF1361 domain-containing protein n=1 Tax=Desertivirga arenae TaxID=2810309 RepID=UPI001A967AB7|nr:DUF1361 domain-containing protein [Pedobacter sp. SYSU D00823]
MLAELKKIDRANTSYLLVIMSVFSLILSVLRFLTTGTGAYLFLNWNLFLAFIPWFISTYVIAYRINRRWVTSVLIFIWLLFFPNSPYILTDLFHLRSETSAPIWFDLILILSFAWTGLLYGFQSLMDIEALLEQYMSRLKLLILTSCFLFLSAFGIYLGRFLRWNSWDILSSPWSLLYDIIERLIHPIAHPQTWGFTILIGLLLNMMYCSFKLVRR